MRGNVLDVRKLALLREVALHSGITGAARALGMSVSSVSQHISRLQQETGVALLETVGRGVRLTPEAERLVVHTERVLATLEEAESELEANRGGVGGVVRLVAFHAFALRMLAPTIEHLDRIAPGLSLEFVQLDPEDAIGELSARRVDLVVADEYPGLALPPSRGLIRTELGREPIDLYLPTGGGTVAFDPESSPSAFGDLPWVTEPRQSDAFRWARGICRALGFEPRVAFESPNLDVHHQLVEAGRAAAFLPRSAAAGLGGRVSGLPVALGRTLLMLTRRGTERSPALLACRAAVEAAFRDAGGFEEGAGPGAS